MLSASPEDLNELHGGAGGGDPRTLDKLVDGHNATTDSNHMWLAPWQPQTGRSHTLSVRRRGKEAPKNDRMSETQNENQRSISHSHSHSHSIKIKLFTC